MNNRKIHEQFDLVKKYQDDDSLESLADFMPMGLMITEKEGDIIYANNKTCIITGYSLYEILELGSRFPKTILFDDSEYQYYSKMIEKFFKEKKEDKCLSMFLRIRRKREKQYTWIYSTSKLVAGNQENELSKRASIICPVNEMGKDSGKIKKVLEDNLFIKDQRHKYDLLTNREKQILALIASGINNPEIAGKLELSRYTVEQHRKNIKRKMEFTNYADLIRFADLLGLRNDS